MNMLHEHNANDVDLVAALPAPPAVTEATLHSDAGPAFVALTKCVVCLLCTGSVHLTLPQGHHFETDRISK
jgi:hypothetical protein